MKNILGLILLFIFWTILSCEMEEKNEHIDHVILAINDLEKGVNQFKDLTGITPLFGGLHPNSFTQNAIVSLGDGIYIEILAPRTDIDSIPDWILAIDSLTPIGWAVSTKDIELTQKKLTNLNLATSKLASGSRETPQGKILKWTTFDFENYESEISPFFINWDKSSIHPSKNETANCKLVKLKLISIDDRMKRLNEELNIDLEVSTGKQERIMVLIECPKGQVLFN